MSAKVRACSRAELLIDELDLEPIVFKLMHPDDGEGMTLEQADVAVVRYRMFLKLCSMYPHRSIVPTKEIDEVWHAHILDTVKYRFDCDQIFGRFLDHFPYFGLRSEEDAVSLADSFGETCELFLRHFGVLPSGESRACGNNCGSTLCENPACKGNSCSGTVNPSAEAIRRLRPRPVRS